MNALVWLVATVPNSELKEIQSHENDVSPELPVNLGYNYIRTHANMGQVSRTSQKQ